MIDRNQLEQVVHAQINEILEANWADVCPKCTRIEDAKVADMLTLGIRPGVDQFTCTMCGKSGVLVRRDGGIWALA